MADGGQPRRRLRLATVVAAWVAAASGLPALAVLVATASVTGGAREAFVLVLLPAAALAAVAILFATLVGRHVARPLVRLRAVAALIGRRGDEQRVMLDRALRDEPYAEVAAVLGTLRDLVTAERENVAQRDRLASFVAHDLRTPLIATSKVLQRGDLSLEQRAGVLRELTWAVRELDNLVAALRSFQATGGTSPPMSVVACVRSLLSTDHRTVPVELAVVQDFGTTIPERSVKSVVQNLVDNAARHAQTRVTVEVTRGRVGVANDLSIDRGHRDIDGGERRHGLGLEIARATLDRYGGRLVIEEANDAHFVVSAFMPLPASDA